MHQALGLLHRTTIRCDQAKKPLVLDNDFARFVTAQIFDHEARKRSYAILARVHAGAEAAA